MIWYSSPQVNGQCVVYEFQCDLCDAGYVGYTCRMIGQHMKEHGENTARVDGCFKVLKNCQSKFECLLFEMLFIKDIRPSMNKQSDSIVLCNLVKIVCFCLSLSVCLFILVYIVFWRVLTHKFKLINLRN